MEDAASLGLMPSARDAQYDAINDEAEAKIEDKPKIHVETMVVCSNRERGQQEEVHDVAQNNGQQRLREINEH
jgi:hypothetical protein